MNKITCNNINKYFHIKDDLLNVLSDINLQVNETDRVAISGISGAGKSTLLHIMAGLDIPNSGNILFNNINLSTISKDELSKVRLNNFGFVYQFHHLLEDLTIEENIQLPSSLLNNLDASKKNLLNDVMITLDIHKRKDHLPWQLSGGEKQRAAIARAISNNPKFLFLDEPTGNLDHVNASIIQQLLFEMSNKYGVALITATHDNKFIKSFDKVYKLFETRLSVLNE
ncbi:MAG: ABC transporter ATP-binding protein [Gammaproteobacteria bacterium]